MSIARQLPARGMRKVSSPSRRRAHFSRQRQGSLAQTTARPRRAGACVRPPAARRRDLMVSARTGAHKIRRPSMTPTGRTHGHDSPAAASHHNRRRYQSGVAPGDSAGRIGGGKGAGISWGGVSAKRSQPLTKMSATEALNRFGEILDAAQRDAISPRKPAPA